MKKKAVAESAIDAHIYKVFPNDLNAHYTMFGGRVMAISDRLALVVAERHSGNMCVTVSIDDVHFLGPAKDGETLVFSAAMNRAWTSSMEIGVRVVTENSYTGERRHIVSAYFTFVALDENGNTCGVPKLVPESKAEKRRYRQAGVRRQSRVKQSK
ncbi:MAG: acyl-CoA thioesterase [Gammaproteobacteria bacterium]|jgi:acyl-CoA hydrolase|nr:acyl-CoA thioesterase [Gammaproteobacteria bacterium]HJP37410.1 acyl-CoA thioesterase [Gammaproteobacteria bacterium]